MIAEPLPARPSEPDGVASRPAVDGASPPLRDEVTVVAGAALRPEVGSRVRLEASDLQAVPRRTAEDALRLVPGFTLVQHGSEGKGHQFFLRGFDAIHGSDLELSVDGVVVNEWSNVHAQGYIDLGFVIGEVVESVVALKGPFDLEQGAFAMAGSARYELGVAPGARGLRGTVSLGTTNRRRGVLTYSPRDGDGRDFVAIEAVRDEGFGENRSIGRVSAMARQRLLDSVERGTLSLLVSGYSAQFALPGAVREDDYRAGRLGFYDTYDAAGRGDSKRGLASLRYEWEGARQALSAVGHAGYRELELLENFTGFLLDPVLGDRRLQRQSGVTLGGDISYRHDLGGALRLVAGGGLRGDRLEQTQRQVDFGQRPVATERDLRVSQALAHARVGIRFQLTDSAVIAGGARFDVAHLGVDDALADRAGFGTLAAVSPRLQLDGDLGHGFGAYAAYGRGFRPPEARALSSFAPERTGISEALYAGGRAAITKADSLEAGGRFAASPRLSLRATGFATFIQRESVYDHVSGVSLELRGTRRFGAEVALEARPTPWLALHADATMVDARFARSGDLVPFVPTFTASALAQVAQDPGGRGWRASLRAFSLAPRPLPHGARGASLAVLDATAGYGFGDFRIDLELENLLDRRLREGEYHHASNFRPDEVASQIPALHYVAGPPFNARLSLTATY